MKLDAKTIQACKAAAEAARAHCFAEEDRTRDNGQFLLATEWNNRGTGVGLALYAIVDIERKEEANDKRRA